MESKDIIGKTFECFEFKTHKQLTYSDQYKKMKGCSAVVTEIHDTYPQFANAKVTLNDGRTEHWHYPTQDIIDQLTKKEEEENREVDLDKLFKLIQNI